MSEELSSGQADQATGVGQEAQRSEQTSEFSVPEEYADRGWTSKVKSTDDLWKQLDNTQKLIGQKSIPTADSGDEEWQSFYEKMTPEKYELTAPEDFVFDNDKLSEVFRKNGVSQRQAQGLLAELVNDISAGKELQMAAQKESDAALDKKFDELAEKTFGKEFAAKAEVAKGMLQDFDFQALAQHPEALVGLIKVLSDKHQEIIDINELMEVAKSELHSEKQQFDQNIQIGIMIEVPSAAILADRLIQHVDFFSIGTNDLIQYTLAVDRNNEKVAKFYKTLNPSVLRLIHITICAAKGAAKDVSLCGEMAGNPLYTALLIGMGLRQFSMSPMMLPEVKERVRIISIKECEELANQVLEMSGVEEIEKILWVFHKRVNKRQTVPCLEV